MSAILWFLGVSAAVAALASKTGKARHQNQLRPEGRYEMGSMTRMFHAVRQFVKQLVRGAAVWFNKITGGKVHPDTVTLVGLAMHVPIALLIAAGYWVWAAVLLVIFGLFDSLDGELARLQKRVTNNGGLLDAVTDRMKEVLLYSGAAYVFATGENPALAVWAVVACGASICVSYVRAKGETIFATEDSKQSYADLNKLFRDGLAPFEIRMFLLVVGLLIGQLAVVVAVLAVLASLAAIKRLLDIRKALARGKS